MAHLAMAVFCEKTLEEKDGVLTLVRVIDRIIQRVEGAVIPETMPQVTFNMRAVITFKAAETPGKHTVKLVPRDPDGEIGQESEYPIVLGEKGKASTLIIGVRFEAKKEGIYWFDVFLDKELVTKMPLRVDYVQVASGTTQTPSD